MLLQCETQETVYEANNLDPKSWITDLILLIKNLENKAWESYVILHVSKDGNATTIALANYELDVDGGMTEFGNAPAFTESIFAADMASLPCLCLCFYNILMFVQYSI